MASENPKDKSPRFNCEFCNTKTNNKKDFNKHLATDKHKKKEFESTSNQIQTEIPPTHICCKCNKQYNSKGGLWYHEKRCSSPKPVTNIDCTNVDYKELVNQLLIDNRELRNFIIEQSKATADTMNKVTKAIENNKPTVINQNNTQNNNQKFNINVFLNEQCKDAMNFSDFIKGIEVSREDLENNAQLGFVGGVSKIILDNLRQLSVNERPIHCTDLKRETMYIKDDDKWTKETGPAKLNTAIQTITQKSTRTLLDWKKENPDYNDNDSEFSTRCIVIQRNSMAGYDRDTYYPKVIRAIAKEVTL